jgi:hypothetical protein
MEGSSASTKVSRVPKCGLVGTWRGNITIPDGADGISAVAILRFSEYGHNVVVKGSANNKPLAIQNAMSSCTDFSFVVPQREVPIIFSGKLSDDGPSVAGTVKRQDFITTWSLQRR